MSTDFHSKPLTGLVLSKMEIDRTSWRRIAGRQLPSACPEA